MISLNVCWLFEYHRASEKVDRKFFTKNDCFCDKLNGLLNYSVYVKRRKKYQKYSMRKKDKKSKILMRISWEWNRTWRKWSTFFMLNWMISKQFRKTFIAIFMKHHTINTIVKNKKKVMVGMKKLHVSYNCAFFSCRFFKVPSSCRELTKWFFHQRNQPCKLLYCDIIFRIDNKYRLFLSLSASNKSKKIFRVYWNHMSLNYFQNVYNQNFSNRHVWHCMIQIHRYSGYYWLAIKLIASLLWLDKDDTPYNDLKPSFNKYITESYGQSAFIKLDINQSPCVTVLVKTEAQYLR